MGFTKNDLIRAFWSFLAGFIATFVLGLQGILEGLATSCKAGACDWDAAGAAVAALVAGIVTALIVSVKNFLLADGSPAKG